jgi:hypothetical protein
VPPGYYPAPDDPLVSPDFGGWWGRSFALLKVAWRPMVLMQLIVIVPTLILGIVGQVVLVRRLDGFGTTTDAGQVDWSRILTPLLIVLPLALIGGLLYLVIELGTYQLMVQALTGRPMSIGDALRAGLRRLLPFLGWGIVSGLLVLLGAVFCILPGVYIGAVVAILPVVILLERGTGTGRCFQLFHADLGTSISRVATIAGLGIGLAIAEWVFTSIFSAVGNPFAGNGPSTPTVIISAVISALFSIVSGVLFKPMFLTAYADMRARHEPFSTAYLMPADDAQPPADPNPTAFA